MGTSTDIRPPCNRVWSHPEPADNEALSPLNTYLAEFRNACRELGGDRSWDRYPPGTWEVDEEGFVRRPA